MSKFSAESPIDNILEDPTFVCNDLSDSDNATPRVTRRTRNSPTHNQEPLDTTVNLFDTVVDQELAAALSQTTSGSQLIDSSSTSKSSTKMNSSEMKAAFKDMSDSFKQIGQSAKQNSTNFLGDLPFYGVPESFDRNKNIIKLSEPTRFLDIVDLVTDKANFTPAGKIQVTRFSISTLE